MDGTTEIETTQKTVLANRIDGKSKSRNYEVSSFEILLDWILVFKFWNDNKCFYTYGSEFCSKDFTTLIRNTDSA